jgi:hypothetical protein
MSSSSTPIVLNIDSWETNSIKYMAPKVNDRGGKSINIISKQTNRSLHISTPLLMTWGITDWIDEKGESDGKFSISLNFPTSDYANVLSDKFLQKLKDFENQILDDAVKNCELWWGEEMSREVAKHTFFPFIKYSKHKDSKKIDTSKPPSIRAKVPNYSGKWAVEIYDTKNTLLFPCANDCLTPIDFVPKLSKVACVLQCGGIWIGGKGWGLTWKLIQCVVKPLEVVSVYGKCHIQLSAEDQEILEKQPIVENDETEDYVEPVQKQPAVAPIKEVVSTFVDDSDDEEAKVHTELLVKIEEPLPDNSKPDFLEPKPVVKKVIKKSVEPVELPVETSDIVVKKKVIKKKV